MTHHLKCPHTSSFQFDFQTHSHWFRNESTPGFILHLSGHQKPPLMGNPALTSRVHLSAEAAATAAATSSPAARASMRPVALVVAVCHHVWQPRHQWLNLIVIPVAPAFFNTRTALNCKLHDTLFWHLDLPQLYLKERLEEYLKMPGRAGSLHWLRNRTERAKTVSNRLLYTLQSQWVYLG